MKDASDNEKVFDYLNLDHGEVSLCLDRESNCVVCYRPTDPEKAYFRVAEEISRLQAFEAALMRRLGLKEATEEA